MHDVRDPGTLHTVFCDLVAGACGAADVTLGRVVDDRWHPWPTCAVPLPVDRSVPMRPTSPEHRAALERRPTIRRVAVDGPPPFVEHAETARYVVLPLVTSRGVVGLAHAAVAPVDDELDAARRDMLWVLASSYARLHERASLRAHLAAAERHVRDATTTLLAQATAILDAETSLHRDRRPQNATGPLRRPAGGPPLDHLTPRQRQIARLLAAGESNAAIAQTLVIAEGTVKTHVKAVMRKIGAATRAEAIALLHGRPTRQ
jgi:DNA-binding CsgD family transcriptional regulator